MISQQSSKKPFELTQDFEQIPNEESLLEQLTADVLASGMDRVLFIAGHFPLLYDIENKISKEGINEWGAFSPYSLELACKVAKRAKEFGKEVQFAIVADDHSYRPEGVNSDQLSNMRKRTYGKYCGVDAKLPEEFNSIMEQYGFSEKHVASQKRGRRGIDCLIISELLLRKASTEIENVCAKSYVGLLEDPTYVDKETTHVVAFIPSRCMSNICNFALNNYVTDLSSSHVFMQTDPALYELGLSKSVEDLWKENLYNTGITYKRTIRS